MWLAARHSRSSKIVVSIISISLFVLPILTQPGSDRSDDETDKKLASNRKDEFEQSSAPFCARLRSYLAFYSFCLGSLIDPKYQYRTTDDKGNWATGEDQKIYIHGTRLKKICGDSQKASAKKAHNRGCNFNSICKKALWLFLIASAGSTVGLYWQIARNDDLPTKNPNLEEGESKDMVTQAGQRLVYASYEQVSTVVIELFDAISIVTKEQYIFFMIESAIGIAIAMGYVYYRQNYLRKKWIRRKRKQARTAANKEPILSGGVDDADSGHHDDRHHPRTSHANDNGSRYSKCSKYNKYSRANGPSKAKRNAHSTSRASSNRYSRAAGGGISHANRTSTALPTRYSTNASSAASSWYRTRANGGDRRRGRDSSYYASSNPSSAASSWYRTRANGGNRRRGRDSSYYASSNTSSDVGSLYSFDSRYSGYDYL